MKQTIHMIATLTIIASVVGALLSYVAGWAAPKIEMNKKKDTEQAIFKVQPGAKKFEKLDLKEIEVYKVFDDSGKALGYAMPYEGNGFQGKIRLMFGIKNDLKELTGLEILEQAETPGLGAKIVEDDFRKQFLNLVTQPLIEWVKGAKPEKENQIQTITGATISSKAVVAILNDGIKKLSNATNTGGEK